MGWRFCRIVTIIKMQFGVMSENETVDAISILRSLQYKYFTRGKGCVL